MKKGTQYIAMAMIGAALAGCGGASGGSPVEAGSSADAVTAGGQGSSGSAGSSYTDIPNSGEITRVRSGVQYRVKRGDGSVELARFAVVDGSAGRECLFVIDDAWTDLGKLDSFYGWTGYMYFPGLKIRKENDYGFIVQADGSDMSLMLRIGYDAWTYAYPGKNTYFVFHVERCGDYGTLVLPDETGPGYRVRYEDRDTVGNHFDGQ